MEYKLNHNQKERKQFRRVFFFLKINITKQKNLFEIDKLSDWKLNCYTNYLLTDLFDEDHEVPMIGYPELTGVSMSSWLYPELLGTYPTKRSASAR